MKKVLKITGYVVAALVAVVGAGIIYLQWPGEAGKVAGGVAVDAYGYVIGNVFSTRYECRCFFYCDDRGRIQIRKGVLQIDDAGANHCHQCSHTYVVTFNTFLIVLFLHVNF